MLATYKLTVDGHKAYLEADADTPLLYVLSDQLGLRNPPLGCGLAQCGACMALVDGDLTRSCVLRVSAVEGTVTTIAGLGTPEKRHPLQTTYTAEEVASMATVIMAGVALLAKNTASSDAHIAEASRA